MIARPQTDEYGAYYGNYISQVPEGVDIIAYLKAQPDEVKTLLKNITDEQANAHPAPGEWSIKEIVGHLGDAERVFAYRGFRISRGDETPLPGFEQDDYVRTANFNTRSLTDLIEEFTLQRQANMLLFSPITQEQLARRGTASGYPLTPRAALYIMAGHVNHHIRSLKTDYHVSG